MLAEANSPRADMMAKRKIEATFRHHVAGLSAHQKMAWAKAAQAEEEAL
jgi:hypothetical protein